MMRAVFLLAGVGGAGYHLHYSVEHGASYGGGVIASTCAHIYLKQTGTCILFSCSAVASAEGGSGR
jgi:hypothetical protein